MYTYRFLDIIEIIPFSSILILFYKPSNFDAL